MDAPETRCRTPFVPVPLVVGVKVHVEDEMAERGGLYDNDELLLVFDLMDIVAQPWIRCEWPLIRR